MKQSELNEILRKHKLWLDNKEGGERANLYNADLRYADLSDANLRYANLRNANLRNADLRYANLSNADLRKANLYNADLRYADLSDANLRYANLHNSDLRNADLRYANLSNADLFNADLRNADLRKADLSYADLRNAKGVLSFIGEKHQLIYYEFDDVYRVKVGCIDKPIDEMLKEFETIGKENCYTDSEIELYGQIIKLFSKYEIKE